MKNLKYLIIILALVSTVVESCKHKACKGRLCISGQVMDETTNKPVAGATVLLGIEKYGGGTFTLRSFVDSFVTNENGEYQFFIDTPSTEGTYTLFPKKAKYFGPQYWENIHAYEGAVRKTLFLHPEAWLKLHLKNVNPYDYMYLDVDGENKGHYNIAKIDSFTFAYRIKGNIQIEVRTNTRLAKNIDEMKIFKIHCPANDTTILDVLF